MADAYSFTAASAPRPVPTAQAFAGSVAASDGYEIAAAKLAQRMGDSDAVRSFARQMIRDHAVAIAELRDAVGRGSGVAVSGQLTSAQAHDLEQLRRAGGGFDGAYATNAIADHERELSELRAYANYGKDPALSGFAADAENMAADHLRLARKLT